MRSLRFRLVMGVTAGALALVLSCDSLTDPDNPVVCDADNGGITLPHDFCAVVVADLVMGGLPARARHMVVTPAGDVFVAINSPDNLEPPFGVIGMRDNDGDGKADAFTEFSRDLGGNGLAWDNGKLYLGANDRVVRFDLPNGQLAPTSGPEVVVTNLPDTGDYISKTVVLADQQTLYVSVGSRTNSCQVSNRQALSPGVSPCPELSTRAGVWVFNPNGKDQSQAVGQRYATGLRNMVALAVHPITKVLYGVQHGRELLFDNWPQFYSVEQNAVLPAEELVLITNGSDNGWPYCYFDAVFEKRKVLAPEYGGNGRNVSLNGINCLTFNQPIMTFGAHWAPDGMTFYEGTQFPVHYQGGLFIAFHGGFDRAPLPNQGFNVMFVPMDPSGVPLGPLEIFADGFADSTASLPATALHRPVGVTEGPDGSLYVSDDKGGRIWRIVRKP